MKTFFSAGLLLTGLFFTSLARAHNVELDLLKSKILSIAEGFAGQGDPDFSKQKALQVYVDKLLEIAPPQPIKQRLGLLNGVWKQVWGPYDYRNEYRGVDPKLVTNSIYQVISSEGYYYNVSYLRKNGDSARQRIGLLRGKYRVDESQENLLRVRFTSYSGASKDVPGYQIWELPQLAENNELPNRVTIVPWIIVRLFFEKGALREVYTDEDLRITYGSSSRNFAREAIYIMKRVGTH